MSRKPPIENIYAEEINFEKEYLLLTDYDTKAAVEVTIDKNNKGEQVITIRSTFKDHCVTKMKRLNGVKWNYCFDKDSID